jgi:hypothetical protein
MRPTFHHELATARVADLHQYAARERAAKAVSVTVDPGGRQHLLRGRGTCTPPSLPG